MNSLWPKISHSKVLVTSDGIFVDHPKPPLGQISISLLNILLSEIDCCTYPNVNPWDLGKIILTQYWLVIIKKKGVKTGRRWDFTWQKRGHLSLTHVLFLKLQQIYLKKSIMCEVRKKLFLPENEVIYLHSTFFFHVKCVESSLEITP